MTGSYLLVILFLRLGHQCEPGDVLFCAMRIACVEHRICSVCLPAWSKRVAVLQGRAGVLCPSLAPGMPLFS